MERQIAKLRQLREGFVAFTRSLRRAPPLTKPVQARAREVSRSTRLPRMDGRQRSRNQGLKPLMDTNSEPEWPTRIFTDFTDGLSSRPHEGNEDLTESLRDRIMGKPNSENLRGLRKLLWIVVRMDTGQGKNEFRAVIPPSVSRLSPVLNLPVVEQFD